MSIEAPTTINDLPSRIEGRFDVLGGISTLLAGYSGGITIVRELAQNTDDVPGDDDRWLELHFQPDQLIIKNNTIFRPKDFENIATIARGGKREEQRRTIGAFGVGFVSVYQLTDTPIVRSNGRELRLEPGLHEFPIYQQVSSVLHHTEFALPYRRRKTVVSERLSMPPVTDQWLHDILRDLPMETYRLLFFLRRLCRITVFHNGQLLSEVRRTITSDPADFERITLAVQRATEAPQTHTWLRFTGTVQGNAPERPDGKPAKDRAVHVVVPDGHVPDAFLREHGSGRLYNYLPTEIETGLPFQINGDFYPSTDRKNIDNDHPNSRDWNTRVLAAIGQCAARALPKLLTHFADAPLQLYRRTNVGKAREVVAPVATALIKAARPLNIFFTNGGWRERIDTRWVEPELRDLAEQMSPALMSRELQDAAWHFIEKLDVSEFTFAHLRETIRKEIKPGTALSEGPSYLQTIEQIEALYKALDSGIAQGQEELVGQTPMFLDHTGRLWPASQCVHSPKEELRKDLAESGLHFWNFDPDRYRFAASLVKPFALSYLWEALRHQIPVEIALADAPDWLNTPTKLYRLYRTIDRTREEVLKSEVTALPICLNREQRLCRPDKLLLPDGEPVLYELLAEDSAAPLVAKPIYDDKDYRRLYLDCGVPLFTIDRLFERLSKLAREELPVEQANPCFNSREKLLKLYRFLQSKSDKIETKQREDLRHRLPIWLCRDGFLRRAKDRALPPESIDLPEYIALGQVLDIEHSNNLRSFLTEIVGLKPLALDQVIKQSLIPQYAALNREQQFDALRFLRSCTETIRTNEELRNTLRQTALIRGDDEMLHRPAEVCYRDASCLTLFPARFTRLHNKFYAEPNAGTADNWPWHELFRLLEVSFHAPKTVVLDEIKQAIVRPPRQERERIEKIFRYIEEHWESFYQQRGIANNLRNDRWLPAVGDDQRWYMPSELYQRQEIGLVGYVAKVLGFSEARRPKQSIADPLGFPISVPVEKIVQQLLILSERGEPVTNTSLYSRLNGEAVTEEQLKPLRNRPVIYANNHYWKANQIFLSDQRKHFGKHRGYVSSADYRRLLERLGAKETPSHKDYADLLCEISAKQRDNLQHDDVALIKNAYEQLASADDLKGLLTLPCVLVSTRQEQQGSDVFALCTAESAVLQPPERLLKLFPALPVARYTPAGEATLRRLGVQPIEHVLRYEYRLAPQLNDAIDITFPFVRLEYALRRLLFHNGRDAERELPDIRARLSKIEGYWQPAIHLTYALTLGTQEYTSEVRSEDSFYDLSREHVYLRKGLQKDDVAEELAVVLGEVLSLREGTQALFAALLRDPANAMKKLDKNNIKALPAEFDLLSEAISIDDLSIGTPDVPMDEVPAATQHQPENLPLPTTDTTPTQPSFDELFDDSSNAGGTRPTNEPRVLHDTPHPHQNTGGRGSAPKDEARPKNERRDTRQEKSPQIPTPPPPARSPAPSRDPAAPPFEGPTMISSPAIPTDYDGLRERARQFAEQHSLPISVDAPTPLLPQMPRKPRQPRPAEEHNHARFVLSFQEVGRGFLMLSERAKSLFPDRPGQVTCHTDDGSTFPLWFEWQRERPIVYNQQALRDFFADSNIPAGGIVYLQREHGTSFRLYYNHYPHTVREVRIAFNEQGQVHYEMHDTQIECETDEAIYRAERRFEDQTALWLEAVGKKSIEESLCDLLMCAPELWLSEDDLKNMLATERMVAASTVERTLKGKPYFVTDEQGNWRLDPAKLLAFGRDDAVVGWHKATTKLLECDDTTLAEASSRLRPSMNELSGRLHSLELAAAPALSGDADMVEQIQLLNADPQNIMLNASITKFIQQRVAAPDIELAHDTSLRSVFNAANDEVWQFTLRPALHTIIEQLQHKHEYIRAHDLAQNWIDHDQAHGLDLARLSAESKAWALIANGTLTLSQMRRAIEIAPTLAIAREKLHMATQAALRQHEPEYYLTARTSEAAVDAFVAHVVAVTEVRPLLSRADQQAFDRTAMEAVRHVWFHLDEQGRVRLLLKITHMIDLQAITLKETEVTTILVAAEHAGETLAGLLLGHAAWQLSLTGQPLQRRIADHLAHCHITMEIWEKANNQPWKKLAQEQLIKELERGCTINASNFTSRERKIIELLRQPDETPHGSTLAAERAKLLARYEGDYQKALRYAA